MKLAFVLELFFAIAGFAALIVFLAWVQWRVEAPARNARRLALERIRRRDHPPPVTELADFLEKAKGKKEAK